MAIIYGLKVNLSVAMVAMLNHTAIRLENNSTTVTITDDSCGNSSSTEAGGVIPFL